MLFCFGYKGKVFLYKGVYIACLFCFIWDYFDTDMGRFCLGDCACFALGVPDAVLLG